MPKCETLLFVIQCLHENFLGVPPRDRFILTSFDLRESPQFSVLSIKTVCLFVLFWYVSVSFVFCFLFVCLTHKV